MSDTNISLLAVARKVAELAAKSRREPENMTVEEVLCLDAVKAWLEPPVRGEVSLKNPGEVV